MGFGRVNTGLTIMPNTQDFPPTTPFLGEATDNLVINQQVVGFNAGRFDTDISNVSIDALPTGIVHGIAIAPNNKWAVAASASSPFITFYKITEDEKWVKLPNPSVLPPGVSRTNSCPIAISPDSTKVLMGLVASPYLCGYDVNIDTETITPLTLASDIGLSSNIFSVAFHPHDNLVALGSSGIKFCRIIDNVIALTTISISVTGNVWKTEWNPTGAILVATNNNSFYAKVYKYDGSSIKSLEDLTGITTSSSPMGVQAIFMGNLMIMSVTSSTASARKMYVFEYSGETFTPRPELSSPDGLPSVADGYGLRNTPDNRFLFIGGASSFFKMYEYNGEAFTDRTSLLTGISLPAGQIYSIAVSKNSEYLAVGCATAPCLRVYKTTVKNIISPSTFLGASVASGEKSFMGFGFARENVNKGNITVADMLALK